MALHCIHGGECDGCMQCQSEPMLYTCPICGAELDGGDEVYISPEDKTVFGCWQCIVARSAEEALNDD